MYRNPFTDKELAGRLALVQDAFAARDLEMGLVSTPEKIFYLTGLDHWGYFAPHLLMVPTDGEMTMIAREMERVSVERQVRNALFAGHLDNETPADLAVRMLGRHETAKKRASAALGEARDADRAVGAAGWCG